MKTDPLPVGLEALPAKWKLVQHAMEKESSERVGRYGISDKEHKAYCDGKAIAFRACREELEAVLSAEPRQPHTAVDPDLLSDVIGFLKHVEWSDTTSETDASNLIERLRAALAAP